MNLTSSLVVAMAMAEGEHLPAGTNAQSGYRGSNSIYVDSRTP
jgi:hypothetical protein